MNPRPERGLGKYLSISPSRPMALKNSANRASPLLAVIFSHLLLNLKENTVCRIMSIAFLGFLRIYQFGEDYTSPKSLIQEGFFVFWKVECLFYGVTRLSGGFSL